LITESTGAASVSDSSAQLLQAAIKQEGIVLFKQHQTAVGMSGSSINLHLQASISGPSDAPSSAGSTQEYSSLGQQQAMKEGLRSASAPHPPQATTDSKAVCSLEPQELGSMLCNSSFSYPPGAAPERWTLQQIPTKAQGKETKSSETAGGLHRRSFISSPGAPPMRSDLEHVQQKAQGDERDSPETAGGLDYSSSRELPEEVVFLSQLPVLSCCSLPQLVEVAKRCQHVVSLMPWEETFGGKG
jgi:hypothetical protein